jgi:hypothetical protein
MQPNIAPAESLPREFTELRQELEELSTLYTDNPFVHDCSDLARVLAKHSGPLGDMLLIGFWTDPKSTRTYVIRSASFLVSQDEFKTLDNLLIRGRYVEEPLSAIESEFGFDAANSVIKGRSNVRCSFHLPQIESPTPDMESVCEEIAAIYQRLLLTSQNFDNFIGGRIYRLSKPPEAKQFHPHFQTQSEIAQAISINYDIAASYFVFLGTREAGHQITVEDFRRPDGGRIPETIPFASDSSFQRKLEISVRLKQPIVGVTDTLPLSNYCIFPISDPSIRQSPVEGALVVWSPERLVLSAYRASNTWLKEFAALKHIKRARFLADLRRETELELKRAWDDGWRGRTARQLSIQKIGQFLCKNLCDLTNAESATLRLRHDTQNLIRSYGRASTPLGQYIFDATTARPNLDIRVDEWQHSAIAFAFHYQEDDPYLYFENVDNVPKKYREAGLKSILRLRESMHSEAVMRIRRGGLLAAVINVESPIEGAFAHELDFLTDCAAIISDYLSRLEAISDRFGLATMAETQIQIHRIKSFILGWTPPNPTETDLPDEAQNAVYICKRLKEGLVRQSVRDLRTRIDFAGARVAFESQNSVRQFNRILHDKVHSYLKDTGSDQRINSVFDGQIPKHFPFTDLSSIVVIMDSIWENITTNSKLKENRITLKDRPQPFAKKRVLTIHWIAPTRLPDSINRDELFLRPLQSEGGPHYGFFLIGVHARLLGGHVELEEFLAPARGFALRAFIPYDPVDDGAAA